MIRVNVEVNTKSWYKKIKNPNKYFSKKLKKISKIIPHIKGKNIIFTILMTNSLNIKKLNKKFTNVKLYGEKPSIVKPPSKKGAKNTIKNLLLSKVVNLKS